MGTDVQCNRDDNKSTGLVRRSPLIYCKGIQNKDSLSKSDPFALEISKNGVARRNFYLVEDGKFASYHESEPRHIHKYFYVKGLEACRITQEAWHSTSVN